MKLQFYIVFLFSFPSIFLAGQENYNCKTFTVENGLPHNHVTSIAKDSSGYLWIATWDGLSRYDGYEFKNYHHNPADSTTIPYFSCQKVVVDKNNNVWVSFGSISPPALYERHTDKFITVLKEKSVAPGYDIAVDKDGNFWFINKEGLFRYDNVRRNFIRFEVNGLNLNESNPINAYFLSFDDSGNFWVIITGRNLSVSVYRGKLINNNTLDVDFVGSISTEYFTLNYRNVSNPPSIYNFYISTNGQIWCSTGIGLYFLNGKNEIFERWTYKFPPLSTIFKNSLCFLNPDNGIKIFYPWEQKTHILVPGAKTLPSCLIENENSVWLSYQIGSGEGTGLTHFVKTPAFFKHYFQNDNLSGNADAYFSVIKDRTGDVWAAPRNENYIIRIKSNGDRIHCNMLDEKTFLLASHPRAMVNDSAGIWIGYYNKMLMYYDFQNSRFTRKAFTNDLNIDKSLPASFHNLALSGSQELVVMSLNSVFSYNIDAKIFKKEWENKDKMVVYSLTVDRSGGYWLGSQFSYVIHLDKKFSEIGRYKLGIGSYNVESVCVGDNNDVWAALLGGGLARLDLATGKSDIFTTADGLSNNTAYSILKDQNSNLWISTNQGISMFNPKTRHFRVFGLNDGLRIIEFNSEAKYQAPDGEMFFGGMGDIVSFYPDSLLESGGVSRNAPLAITGFKVSGFNRNLKTTANNTDSVLLNRGDNNFLVSFACLDFTNAEKIKYRYRLTGEDKDWTKTDFLPRFVSYASLSPNKYLLELEATNPEGEWSTKKSLLVVIPPFFYQTIWFKLSIFIAISSLLAYLVFMYTRQIRLKARQKQDELRLESLRGQMNPHFIFNSLNSINYFISQNDRLSANRFIADFSRLIRSFLGNLSQEYIPLNKELESLYDYLQLEHLLFGDKFSYEIVVGETVAPEEFLVCPGMVQPFIENAIWHGVRGLEGRKGFVKIRFGSESNRLQCTVEDDGIGRKLSEIRKNYLPGKTSRGIGIVLERLRIINNLQKTSYAVKIEDLFPDREETGTRVTVDIPVKKAI